MINMYTSENQKSLKRELKLKELLVFGYSCKLFRDDEKALYIDQGKHLITWMGDETVKIDRYDGRGALYDLKQHESSAGGYDSMISLTNEEKRIEQMCDEERYFALQQNEEVDLLYQEEELKRLQESEKNKKYGQVGFNYDDENSNNPVGDDNDKQGGDEDDVFVLIPQLDIPVNTQLPTSKKHFAIIEKTASFIHTQGAQMEILLKMKQAGNPQFGFLSFDNPLYPFYRNVLSAIQSGRYLPGTYEQSTAKETEHNSSGEQEHYLHPSLQVPSSLSSLPESAPSVPSIAYKPSENCAYSMLINKIKEKQTILPAVLPNLGVEVKTPEVSQSPASTASHSRSNSPTPPPEHAPPPPAISKPTVAAPVVISKSAVISKAPEYYNPEDAASDSEDESELAPDPKPEIIVPPADLKLIIDKLVVYVAKNGRDFEIIVKRKCDPRFSFLEPVDKHNAYYESELAKLLPPTNGPETSNGNSAEDNSQKQSLLRFSIKKPRPDKPIPSTDTKVKSALEDPSSEDENELSSKSEDTPSAPPPPMISEPLVEAPPPPDIRDKHAPTPYDSTRVNGTSSQQNGASSQQPCATSKSGSVSQQTGVTSKCGAIGQQTGASSLKIGATSNTGAIIGETDEKKAERKRRAEMFLKMLKKTGEVTALTPSASTSDTDDIQHIGTVQKVEKSDNFTVINIIDSEDEVDDKFSIVNEGPTALDLKARLEALRGRSKSPVSRGSAHASKMRKSSHHSKHRKHDKKRSRSRSSDSDRSLSKRSRNHKKARRRSQSRSPSSSPERSHKHRKSSKSSKKKKKNKKREKSPSPVKKKSSKSKRKKKKSSSSDSD